MKPSPVRIRGCDGFALVVTLSLLILLTVVAVGLLSLSTITLRSSTQDMAMATARANARFALILAIGDLQKYAGPDQRVTARAELAESAPNPLHTGVWDSSATTLDKTAPLVWLVSGNNVTGLASAPLASVANTGREVRASIQEVKSMTGNQPTGAFAYWVADEGVKARMNLDAPGYRANATATDAARAFAGSPRLGIELMETGTSPASGTVSSPWTSNLYPYVAESAPKAITIHELPLYNTSDSRDATQAATKSRFHDLTAHSSSVLANSADGGLRQDLTRVLSDPTKPGPADSNLMFPANGALPSDVHRRPPTWGRLREWWNKPVDPVTGEITPSLADASAPPVAPVVVWAELGLAFFVEDLGTATPPGQGFRLRVQAFPRAILWNPYSVPMAGRTYELGISSLSPAGGASDRIVFERQSDGTPVGSYYLSKYSFSAGSSSKYARFNITVPRLEPGQAKAFSLASVGSDTLQSGYNPETYTIWNASTGDRLDSMLSPPYRIRVLIPPVHTYYAGSMGFYLRDKDQADPGPPNVTNIPSKTYQFSGMIGFNQQGITGLSEFLSMPPTGSTAPQAHLRIVTLAWMDQAWIRWMANCNQLAPVQIRHSADGSANPFNNCNIFSSGTFTLPITPVGDVSINTKLSAVMDGNGMPGRLVLREPRLRDIGLYQSIAHLQHAPLCDTAAGPLNVVGNSLQSPRIPIRSNTSIPPDGDFRNPLYDSSYLLNQALWDKYFFSTLPSTLTAAELAAPDYKPANARLQTLPSANPANLISHEKAAGHLMLSGAFNINSTSEQAWRAVLSAALDLKYNPVTRATAQSDPLRSPFSRFMQPTGDSNDRYRGYRQLTDAQIAALASKIVAEVRTRGPFRSLADFVNRRLVDNSSPQAATGLKGALQAAIDAVDIDPDPAKRINHLSPYTMNITGTFYTGNPPAMDNEAWLGVTGTQAKTPTSSRNVFGPGYLTQADVLSRIGSAITARSDTFVIRSYGEARNAAGNVEARAWAEAVVQRSPAYIDPTTAPEALPATATPNARFGRRFTMISFRWLSPNEL